MKKKNPEKRDVTSTGVTGEVYQTSKEETRQKSGQLFQMGDIICYSSLVPTTKSRQHKTNKSTAGSLGSTDAKPLTKPSLNHDSI